MRRPLARYASLLLLVLVLLGTLPSPTFGAATRDPFARTSRMTQIQAAASNPGPTVTPTAVPSAPQQPDTPLRTRRITRPTPVPTLTPPPDIDYIDQAIDAERDAVLAEVAALPPVHAAITATLVSGATGARVLSADGNLTVGLRRGVVAPTEMLGIEVHRRSFPAGDPRATRQGQPLAYTYELTATHGLGGPRVTHFAKPVALIWTLDSATLAAAGVQGFPPRVYTYDEQTGAWVEILSRWNPQTHQLLVLTPHFSIYAVGDGFDVVNNYVPTVNNFEVGLQSGAATVQYPINLPAGPGGFGPKVSLSYNSGAIDRVDMTQQGPSSVGWGWTLSTNYVAASQHHFDPHGTPYDPWTVSIVADGVNGDLIQGQDSDTTTGKPIWHTAQESFARVEYSAGTGTHTDDSWDAWDKDGTHYVFDLNALITDDSHSIRVTNRWMLHTATDVHGNAITYSYAYEDGAGALHYSPIVTGTTAAVYPYQITYGAGGDKIQVTFEIVSRTINSATDATQRDRNSGVSQGYRIDKISVQRRQASTSSLALLRAYTLTQDYSTVLTPTTGLTTTVTRYAHLTLTAINPKGNDGTTALPSTTFDYIQGATPCCPLYPEQDYGHLWHAYNGYGGEVGFYYDAAGAEVNQAYRRVRAKRIVDGLGYDAIHDVPYFYDYRGATVNTVYKSDEAADPYALHTAKNEFRGFAFVREQDPMGQVTDHYYSQDDVFKAKEWRVQAGKTVSFTDSMDAVPPGAAWSAVGTVSGGIDPNPPTPTATPTPPANRYWSMTGAGATLERQAGVSDGADVSIRFRIQGAGATPTAQPFAGTWKLENANGNGEYWGLQIYSSGDRTNGYTLAPKVIWGKQVNGSLQQGSRDLAPTATYRPTRAVALAANQWYRLQLHTSPDGRFAFELYRDDTQGEYVQIKAADLDDNGQPIPALPTGQIWRFQQAITQDGNNTWSAWADDYSESRTVYSQADTVNTSLPATAATARDFTKLYAGDGNNCDSMSIRFVAATEQQNTIFGADTQLGQTKRTKKTYAYDSYGNQTSQVEYGDLDQTGDERNTQSSYVVSTAPYIVSKPGWTKTYSSTTTTTELAETHYYYDNQASYGIISANGHGDLTKVEQIGVLNGTLTGQSSTQQFQYDSYGNQTRVTDPEGNPTNTSFDSYYVSFPIQVGHPNGRNETMDYDYTLDVVTRTVDMNGTVTQRRYDAFGRPAKAWIEGFGTQTTPNESYQFADSGQSSVPAPFYISYSRLLTGTQTTWQTRWLDGLGRPVQDVSPKDATTAIVVDTTYTTTGVISSTTVPYLATNNNPLTHVTPDLTQAKTTHYYDGLRRPSQVVNPDSTAVTYDYSLLQWVGTQDESGHQKWQRTDMLGRTDLIEEVDNTGYDPNLVYTGYAYDLLDRLTQVTRDQDGPNETTSTISYDGLGRKSDMQDPDMGHWQYEYDDAGNLLVQRDALYLSDSSTYADHQIFFEYDKMNRLTTKAYGLAHHTGGIADVKYYYDNDLQDAATAHSWGRLRLTEVTVQGQGTAKANGHGYLYDARGLTTADVVTTTYNLSRTYTVNYAYDQGGRLTAVTYPDAETVHEQVTVGYNTQGAGLLNQLTSSRAGNPYPVYSAGYNARGQLSVLQQGSGPTNSNLLTTNFTYDTATTNRGWLTRTLVTTSNATLLDLNQTYTPNGDIATITQNAGGTNSPTFSNSFTYDGFNRLRLATSTLFGSEEYWFDTLSRMPYRDPGSGTVSYDYDDPAHIDAPTGYGSDLYEYDANGNQVLHTFGGVPQTQSRGFDPENRLVSTTDTDTSSNTVLDSSADVYDGNGKRLVRSVTASNGTTTSTLYVGNLYEEQLTGSATPPYIVYYFLAGKAVGLRRANQPAGNGQYRLVGDYLGSTTLLVDTSSSPVVLQRQYFKPYGEQAWQYTAQGSLTSHDFTGQRLDRDTGLLYYGARYYDPALSYFISADPTASNSSTSKTFNKYLYTQSNPLRYIDTTGYAAEDYYIYVNGCLDHSNGDNCADRSWNEYLQLLHGLFDQGHWGIVEMPSGSIHRITFEQWAFQHDGGHVRFIGAPGLNGTIGADNIQKELTKIHGTGNIHLVGHSMGGTAVATYFFRTKHAGEFGFGSEPLDARISDATLIDPYTSTEDIINDLGDWANNQGVNFKAFDAQGDGVGGCSTSTNYCEPNPDYSVDLQGNQRARDLAPNGTGHPWDSSSRAEHAYTFSHVAKQTQDWLRIVWR